MTQPTTPIAFTAQQEPALQPPTFPQEPPAFPEPTTKPAGSSFSTASIVLAIISLFIGGFILAAAAIGLGIRARIMHQPRAAVGIGLGGVSLVANALLLLLLTA